MRISLSILIMIFMISCRSSYQRPCAEMTDPEIVRNPLIPLDQGNYWKYDMTITRLENDPFNGQEKPISKELTTSFKVIGFDHTSIPIIGRSANSALIETRISNEEKRLIIKYVQCDNYLLMLEDNGDPAFAFPFYDNSEDSVKIKNECFFRGFETTNIKGRDMRCMHYVSADSLVDFYFADGIGMVKMIGRTESGRSIRKMVIKEWKVGA